MKIAIYRNILLSALDRVIKVMPSSKISPVLNYVLVEAKGDQVQFTATDLSNFITVKVAEVKVGEEGTALIPAADFYAALKTTTSAGVVIAFNDGTLQLKSSKTSWNWKVIKTDVFPQLPQWEESNIYTLSCKSFVHAMRRVKPAAAYQSFSSNLQQIGFLKGKVQAADGSRFHQVFVEDSDLEIAFPLPYVQDLISILSTVSEDNFELGVTKDKDAIVVRCSDFVLSTKTKAEKFPDVNSAFLVPAMKNYIEVTVDKKKLIDSIKRVQVTANKDTRVMKMVLSTKDISLMTLVCTQNDGSYSTDSVAISGPLENREIVVSIDHLTQALNLFSEDAIVMRLSPDQKNRPSTILIQDDKCSAVLNQLRL